MFRRIAAVLILTGLTTGPSLAESFKGVRCEDPKVIAILEEQIKSPFIGGRSFQSYGVHTGKITKATTITATTNKLVCGITLRLTARGEPTSLRLRFTIQQFGNGQTVASMTPM